ncbi:hypothetical protein BT69DRAFT_1340729 [Atractiella rhizophila]|nr:hypothetical protein BT69DRAFT_1340729 [Atractiella rhizophila]
MAPIMAATYPQLTVDEIIDNLRLVSLALPPEEIENPSAARVQMVYDAFLLHFFRITRDQISRQISEGLASVEHSEIYAETVGNMVYWRTVEQLMKLACVDDFGLRDCTMPEGKRFKNHCSALVNLLLFDEEQREQVLAPEEEKLESVERESEMLKGRIQELQKRRDELLERNRKKEQEAQEVERRTGELSASLRSVRGEMKEWNGKVTSARAERDDLVQRTTNTSLTSTQLDSDIARLKGRLISSPEKLLQSLSEMRTELAREKGVLGDIERNAESRREKISVVEGYGEEIRKALRLLETYQVDVDALDEVQSRLRNKEGEASRLEEEISDLSTRLSHIQRRLAVTTSNLDRLESQLISNRETVRKRMKALVDEDAELSKEREELGKVEMDKLKLLKDLEDNIKAIVERGDREMADGREKYEALKDGFYQYSNKLNRAMDQLRAYESAEQ